MDDSELSEGVDDPDAYVTLAEAKIPGDPHIATRFRWRTRGVKRGGRTVKLRTVSVGSRVWTTQRWVDEFIAACSGEAPAETSSQVNEARRRTETKRAVLALI